jgi:hypothetical protein
MKQVTMTMKLKDLDNDLLASKHKNLKKDLEILEEYSTEWCVAFKEMIEVEEIACNRGFVLSYGANGCKRDLIYMGY